MKYSLLGEIAGGYANFLVSAFGFHSYYFDTRFWDELSLVPMSYLDNGSTLRATFRLMPPKRHDIDPAKSEVLAHIMESMNSDLGRSIRAFNSMRNIKSGVLVFDRINRQWRGCDWMPPEEKDKIALLSAAILELKRDLAALKSEVRKKLAGSVRRRSGGRAQPEAEPEEEDVDPDVIEIQKRATEAREAMKMARATIEKDEWLKAMLAALDEDKKASSAPSVPPQ